ncbi:MAG: nucleotidyltransferase domain-containing protein [Actinomycetota bacterium]|nr:nucleotidyltransferase domain-containing protein [Actinomycetota bacterium]
MTDGVSSATRNARSMPDTDLGRLLREQRQAIVDLAARRGATNVRVFGSVARGTDDPSSDVDLLVDLDVGVGLLSVLGLERELGDLLGRKVDVVPTVGLKPAVAEAVAVEAIRL